MNKDRKRRLFIRCWFFLSNRSVIFFCALVEIASVFTAARESETFSEGVESDVACFDLASWSHTIAMKHLLFSNTANISRKKILHEHRRGMRRITYLTSLATPTTTIGRAACALSMCVHAYYIRYVSVADQGSGSSPIRPPVNVTKRIKHRTDTQSPHTCTAHQLRQPHRNGEKIVVKPVKHIYNSREYSWLCAS